MMTTEKQEEESMIVRIAILNHPENRSFASSLIPHLAHSLSNNNSPPTPGDGLWDGGVEVGKGGGGLAFQGRKNGVNRSCVIRSLV